MVQDSGIFHGAHSANINLECQDPVHLLMHPEVIPPSMPSQGYDAMILKYGFDIRDLSSLTTFHVGRLTAQALIIEPHRLINILQCRQWSYFSFLPSRYGNCNFLDDALDCVAARVRQWISYPSEQLNGAILSLYSRALRGLQAALEDPDLWMEPDVLCATEVLALYELLDQSKDIAWVKHAAGATTLITLRGPESYKTDYEKALFLAHVGPIFTEALLTNSHCILEEESWKAVLRSVVNKKFSFSSHSEIVILLWTIIGAIPGLFKDVTDAICNLKALTLHEIDHLTFRVRQLNSQLSQWHQKYEELIHYTNLQEIPGNMETDKRFEILAVYMTCSMKMKRLALALNPLAGSTIEDEAQSLADLIVGLEKRAYAENPRAAIFMVFKIAIVRATIATEGEWRMSTFSGNGEEHRGPTGLIKKQVFERWCNLMGRKMS